MVESTYPVTSYPVTAGAITVPTLALITLIVDTPPIIWHVRNRNIAAAALIFWILISNLFNFVNALLWPTDDIFHWWQGYGLCDIEVKLQYAVTFGVPGSLICIMQSLASVLDTTRTSLSPSKAQRMRKLVTTLLLCFGGPIYSMAIHYIVQPSRYYLFAISGCTGALDNSWPSVVLILIWPPILCIVAAYYSVLVILRMHKYRREFAEVLTSSNSNMTKSRFMRLFWLSAVLTLTVLPTQAYVLYESSRTPFLPYSWDAIHGSEWPVVPLLPAGGKVLFDRWIQIAVGFAVFIFFGLGHDARVMYSKWLLKLGFGRMFPSLSRPKPVNQPQISSGTSSTRKLWAQKWSSRSILSLHSHKSGAASVGTLSPGEPQNGFSNLGTISEAELRPSDVKTASDFANEKSGSTSTTLGKESWLTHFLIRTHLSAPTRNHFGRPAMNAGPHGLGFFGVNVHGNYNQPNKESNNDDV